MASIKTWFLPSPKKSLNYINSLLITHNLSLNLLAVNNATNVQTIRFPRRTRFGTHLPFTRLPAEVIPDPIVAERRKTYADTILSPEMAEMRFKYPEFLPTPELFQRNKMSEKMERMDMIKRRTVIEIPEFYVGSIVSVTISDPNAPGKLSRFMGICIERQGQGTRANFRLRNVIDHQGVEIRYDLYNPTIREITVIRLEKRVDDHLLYLRDALPEYSHFPFDMPPEPHPQGQPVPVNPLKVKMKLWPWTKKWEKQWENLRGIAKMEDVADGVYLKRVMSLNPYEKLDLMLQYRNHTPEDEQFQIWGEVMQHEKDVTEIRRAEKRKKLIAETEKIKK